MRTSRPVVLGALTLAVAGAAAPAIAATHPAKPQPTSLNLRAAHATVAPKHSDSFYVTLSTGKTKVPGEAAGLTLWERTAPTTGHKTTWTNTGASFSPVAGKPGVYSVKVIVPGPKSHPQKDQYVARYKDDTTPAAYGSSHSSVITVTVKPASK